MNQKISEDELLEFLCTSLLLKEAGEKSIRALLSHLADLGLLSQQEKPYWKIEGLAPQVSSTAWKEPWIKQLKKLCEGPRGFALKYFLKDLPDTVSLAYPDPAGFQGAISDGILETSSPSSVNTSSHLSNLQIVKKVGRQLSPLIEMENDFLTRLQGKHTNRQRARHIFNFIISRVKMKGEPREWVQLSRRRHK